MRFLQKKRTLTTIITDSLNNIQDVLTTIAAADVQKTSQLRRFSIIAVIRRQFRRRSAIFFRQFDSDHSSFAFSTANIYNAVVIPDDLVNDRKAETRTAGR